MTVPLNQIIREIGEKIKMKQKFRIWDSKNKKLIYSKPIKNYLWKFDEEGELRCWYNDILIEGKIEQFTEIKDETDKEIYQNDFVEGDIDLSYHTVSYGDPGTWHKRHSHDIGQVFKASQGGFKLITNSSDRGYNLKKYTNLKLLGNIHETSGRCGNCRFFRSYEYGGSYGNGLCFAIKEHPQKELYQGVNCEIREKKLIKDKKIRDSFKVGDKIIGKGDHSHTGSAGQKYLKGKIGIIVAFEKRIDSHDWYDGRKFEKIYVRVEYPSGKSSRKKDKCLWRFENIKLVKVGSGGP